VGGSSSSEIHPARIENSLSEQQEELLFDPTLAVCVELVNGGGKTGSIHNLIWPPDSTNW